MSSFSPERPLSEPADPYTPPKSQLGAGSDDVEIALRRSFHGRRAAIKLIGFFHLAFSLFALGSAIALFRMALVFWNAAAHVPDMNYRYPELVAHNDRINA